MEPIISLLILISSLTIQTLLDAASFVWHSGIWNSVLLAILSKTRSTTEYTQCPHHYTCLAFVASHFCAGHERDGLIRCGVHSARQGLVEGGPLYSQNQCWDEMDAVSRGRCGREGMGRLDVVFAAPSTAWLKEGHCTVRVSHGIRRMQFAEGDGHIGRGVLDSARQGRRVEGRPLLLW